MLLRLNNTFCTKKRWYGEVLVIFRKGNGRGRAGKQGVLLPSCFGQKWLSALIY